MKITPSIKGHLTKIVKANSGAAPGTTFGLIREYFSRHMPRQQAKHATRKYLRTVTA